MDIDRALESPRNDSRRNWSSSSDDNRGRGGGRMGRDYMRGSGRGSGGRRGGGRHLQDRFVRGGRGGRSSGRSSTVAYFGRGSGGGGRDGTTKTRTGRLNFEPARGRGRGTLSTTYSSFADNNTSLTTTTSTPTISQRTTYDTPTTSTPIDDGYIPERSHDNQFHDNASQISDPDMGGRGGRGRSYTDNNDFRTGRGTFDTGRGRGSTRRTTYDDGSRTTDFPTRPHFERSHSSNDRRTSAGRSVTYDTAGRGRGSFEREERFEPSSQIGRDDYAGRGGYKRDSGRGFYRGGRGRGYRGGRSGGRGRFDNSNRDDYQGRGPGNWRDRNDWSSTTSSHEIRDTVENSQEEGEWIDAPFHGDDNNDREWRQDNHRASFQDHERPPPQDDFNRGPSFDRPPPHDDFNRGPRTYERPPPPPPPQEFERPPHEFNRTNSYDRLPPPQDDFGRGPPPRDRPPPPLPQEFGRGPPPKEYDRDYDRPPPPDDFHRGPPPNYDRPPPPDDFVHSHPNRPPPPPQEDYTRNPTFDRPPLPVPVDDFGRERNYDRPPPDGYGPSPGHGPGPDQDFSGPPPHDEFHRPSFQNDNWQNDPPPPPVPSTYGQMADAPAPDWRKTDDQPQKQWGWNKRDGDNSGMRNNNNPIDPPMSPRGGPHQHRSLPGRGFVPRAGGGRFISDAGRGRGHFDDVAIKRKREFEQHREPFTQNEPFTRREAFDQEEKRLREDVPYPPAGRGGWNDPRSLVNRGTRPGATFDSSVPQPVYHEPFRGGGGRGRGFTGRGFAGRGRGRSAFHDRAQFTRPSEPQLSQMPSYASAADVDPPPLLDRETSSARKNSEPEKPKPKPPSPIPEALPPSGFAVALGRLVDAESQLDFAVAKHLQLVKQQKSLRVQIEKLEKLPVGVEAFQDDLEKHIADMKRVKSEIEKQD